MQISSSFECAAKDVVQSAGCGAIYILAEDDLVLPEQFRLPAGKYNYLHIQCFQCDGISLVIYSPILWIPFYFSIIWILKDPV